MTRIIGVIPVRMGSSRFPGKPLATLCGNSMLEHVYQQVTKCNLLDDVFIATCDNEIVIAAKEFNAKTIMTSSTHERASDRVAEATIEDPAEVVVMVQGDEPMILPEMIDNAIRPMLEDPLLSCVNLASLIHSEQELGDRNTIKTVMDRKGNALYFSREPIPTMGANLFKMGEWFKQVCVIPFRRNALQQFASLPQGKLEIAESIDMLRFLENGISVRLVKTKTYTHAVDTPEDLEIVESLITGTR